MYFKGLGGCYITSSLSSLASILSLLLAWVISQGFWGVGSSGRGGIVYFAWEGRSTHSFYRISFDRVEVVFPLAGDGLSFSLNPFLAAHLDPYRQLISGREAFPQQQHPPRHAPAYVRRPGSEGTHCFRFRSK